MRWKAWTILWCAVICLHLLTGCDSETPFNPGILPLYPVHQEEPAWGRNGLVAYRDNGIVWFNGSGSIETDLDLVGIWLIDPTTGSKRRVAPGGTSPSLSPDGSRLVFANGFVFTVRVDGTGVTPLTLFGSSFHPAWSPDGKWIAHEFWAGSGSWSIWLMSSDGSVHQNLTPGEDAMMPTWSPDGSKILHIRSVRGPAWPNELYIMNSDGTNPQRITQNDGQETDPEFSPDGAWIAFSSQTETPPNIYITRPDGTGARQLTSEGGRSPSWSPDGKRIVYVRGSQGRESPGFGVLWVLDVEIIVETRL